MKIQMSALPRRTILAALSLSMMCAAQAPDTARETFTITGKVNNPGTYELRPGARIAEAIAMAGGFADFAQMKKIHLIRGDEQYLFNYVAFEHRKALEANILLVSGDDIVVS